MNTYSRSMCLIFHFESSTKEEYLCQVSRFSSTKECILHFEFLICQVYPGNSSIIGNFYSTVYMHVFPD